MKILITGANGQLGKKLIEKLSGYKLILTDSAEMDITNKKAVIDVTGKEKPDFIIHAAAYTRVDDAETNRDLCYKVNAFGTKNLAEVAQAQHTTLLYVSTDYVFPGTGHDPLGEDDKTDPVNYYGQTKLDGENFIRKICKKYYIIRTAWLYGELPKNHPGTNFVETMLKLAKEKPEVKVVADQIGSPTYTADLVDLIATLCSPKTYHLSPKTLPHGTYHFSGEGEASWHSFAKEIFRQAKINTKLTPITTAEFPRPAKRPAYSYLSKEKMKKAGFPVRPWQVALTEYLAKR